jgi:hypothetical protein
MAEGRFEDLLALDRDVARAAKALASWRVVLADRPDEAAESDPFDGLRAVAARSTWQRLAELSPSATDEPLRAALRRWVLALVQARVGSVDDVAWAREAATARGHYEGERQRRVSWREAWRGVASGRSAAEARLWLEAASDAAAPLAPVARLRSARRAEVARRMGLAHPWAPVASVDLGRLRASAARFLERTDDLSRAVWRESLGAEAEVAAVLHAAVAREAGDGWPARLTPRWIDEQFGAGVRGLPLDLPALPATLGAASFARALALFGYAFRVASAQRTMPFAIANDPWFVGAHRLAFVFGALAADPEFHVRALGVGRRIAERQARVLARTALLEARLGAARVFLGEAEGSPSDAFDEIGARLFPEGRAPLDRRLMCVWPAPRVDEPARWIALLQAPGLRGALRDGFDVDWFRNPRAWAHLVSLGAGPAFEAVDESSLEPGADAVVRSFEYALG